MNDKTRGPSFVRKERPGRRPPTDERVARTEEPPAPPEQETPERPERDRARIVVPRQRRGAARPSDLDIELREVRYGAVSRGPYLRAVPRKRRFTKVAPGHIEATRLASRPRGPVERAVASVKGVIVGSPLATAQAIHERLTKLKGLSILGSDPLSSSAYATEEALLILVLAGTVALKYALPIAVIIAVLLIMVVVSYRQTIGAYPSGGGAYRVSHENLGSGPGLVAAAALMVDYVLLVAVSAAAGIAAITSAVPELLDFAVPMAVVVVLLFTLGNLRGIRESGTIFAAPTYFFIFAMGSVIVVGLVRVALGDAPGSLGESGYDAVPIGATQGVGLWLLLRAFSSGGAALTGVEAISNGVPAFKPPESTNARATLAVMATIAVFLFLGITFLSDRYGLAPEAEGETLVSMLGRSVLGENLLYYGYQAATALILFMAANTSFNAFPLLSAILAQDRYMPRQFTFRGDRLAYSNGIILLALIAIVLLVVFDAEVTRLIPLYAVGVFAAFTLSQSGMVRHWLNQRGAGWRVSIAVNGTGAVATGVVMVVITATKFTHGAWISLLLMGLIVVIFALIQRHYSWFRQKIRVDERVLPLRVPAAVPIQPGGPRDHAIVPVDGVNKITMGAIAMSREITTLVTAVHLTDSAEDAERFREQWQKAVPDIPVLIIESPYRAFAAPMLAYIESLEQTEPDRRIVAVLPSFVAHHWWERILHNRDVLRLRPFLAERPGVRIVDFPYELEERTTPPSGRGPRPVRVRS